MKNKFMISGSEIDIIRMSEDTALDALPPRVYTLRSAPFRGFYLEITTNKLELPSKIYGNTLNRVKQCLTTYSDRSRSTGILMTGDKGTGKTLLTAVLANQVIEKLNLPVVLVNEAYGGAPFITFIDSIGECCLVFDEFGKTYADSHPHSDGDNDASQTSLLTLMDGVDKIKRLFIMTENSEHDISDFMLNRPSRIYYHFRYNKLDESSITGYCNDYEVNTDVITDIIELSRRSRIFSFDMLQSIVEEHLRYNKSIQDVIKDLNVDVRESFDTMIEIVNIIENATEVQYEVWDSSIVSKPNGEYGGVYIKIKNHDNTSSVSSSKGLISIEDTDATDDAYFEVYIRGSNLAYETHDKLVYETPDYTFIATPVYHTSMYSKLV